MFAQFQNLTLKDKYQTIIANKAKFNLIELKAITELADILQIKQNCIDKDPSNFAKMIRLQTFYKCCAPAFYSTKWEQINYKVPYPVTAIVAFRQQGEKYFTVDLKLSTWAQSGGTRLTPLKSSSNKQKIADIIRNTHALIIPQYRGEVDTQFFINLTEVLKEFKDFPVIAFGNSSISLMIYLGNHEQGLSKILKSNINYSKTQMMAFASHQQHLLADLDLKTRLQIQNKQKIHSNSVELSLQLFHQWSKSQSSKIICIGKNKNDDWSVLIFVHQFIHFCFVDPRPNATNMQGVTFSHTLINNFLQIVRSKQKIIADKMVELGIYKVILKQDRYMYNVDLKLPKV